MPTVQAFTHEKIEAERFSSSVENAFATAMRRIRARSLLTMVAILLIFGAIVFVLWLGAHAVVNGEMSAGKLGQFILYASIVAGAIGALSEVLGDAQRAAGATERLLELMSVQSPIAEHLLRRQHCHRRLDMVQRYRFAIYNFFIRRGPQAPALNNINLNIKEGETIALVGSSGAGKTTLFQLLLRFYDPQSGSIAIDGVNIRDLRPERASLHHRYRAARHQ